MNAGADGIEFLWRGRPTRVYQKRGERWWEWNLDDWDNCRAPAWLADRGAVGIVTCASTTENRE